MLIKPQEVIPLISLNIKAEIARMDQTALRLANELDCVAYRLSDFKGIGEKKLANQLDTTRNGYRKSAMSAIFSAHIKEPLFSKGDTIRVDFEAYSALLQAQERMQDDNYILMDTMRTSVNKMFDGWTGEEADLAKLHWDRIGGNKSDAETLHNVQQQYKLLMYKLQQRYLPLLEDDEETLLQVNAVRLRELASWLDRIVRESRTLEAAAMNLQYRIGTGLGNSIGDSPNTLSQETLTDLEKARLNAIRHLPLDDISPVKLTLTSIADATDEADRLLEEDRQTFLQYCYDHPPGPGYSAITEQTAAIPQALETLGIQLNDYPLQSVTYEGNLVYPYFTVNLNGTVTYDNDKIYKAITGTWAQSRETASRLIGTMDDASLAALKEHVEQCAAAEDTTQNGDYFAKSFDEVLKGEYSENVTLLGLAGEVGVGCVPILGQVADARDLAYNLEQVENRSTGENVGAIALSVVGFLPFIGDLKKVKRLVNIKNVSWVQKRLNQIDEIAARGKKTGGAEKSVDDIVEGAGGKALKFSEMTPDEAMKVAREYRTKAPIDIPENATMKPTSKTGYEQISYKWREDTYKYEVRWHTKTPDAPVDQGNSWVITREIPGSGGQKPQQFFKVGNTGTEADWVTGKEWYDAIKARQAGTATPEQVKILDQGHWKE